MPDDSVNPPASQEPKPPLWRRVRAWTIIFAIYAILFGMLWFAIILFSSAIKPGVAWEDSVYKFLEAGALLVLPAKVAWTFIKRKLITGSWFVMTEQEKARKAALRSARQRATTQGAVCRPTSQSWIQHLLSWARYTAWEQSAGQWKRMLAWAVIVLYAAYVLFWIGLGLMGFGASFADDNTARQQVLWILLGLACLIYPALVIRSAIRRFQASGNLRVSQQEFQSVAAQRQQAESKSRQRPLRAKIVSYAIAFAFLGLMWIRATVYHSRHPHESWVAPAIGTFALLYSIWRDFSKPRQSSSQQAAGSFTATQVPPTQNG